MILRIFSLLMLMTCADIDLYAATIRGVVKDKNGVALAGVSIVLLKDDNKTLAVADLTNDAGIFVLDGIANGSYYLKATMAGFDIYESGMLAIDGKDVELPLIQLQP